MADEPSATGGRTPSPGPARGTQSAAAASRIRVDITDVTKLKTAIKGTQTEAKSLSDTLAAFDSKALPTLRKVRTELEAMQRALGVSGVRGAAGPRTPTGGDSGSYIPAASFAGLPAGSAYAATMLGGGAGGFSGQPVTMPGSGGSYLRRVSPMTTNVPVSSLPTYEEYQQQGRPAPGLFSRFASYLTAPAPSGTKSTPPAWSTTPLFRGAVGALGAVAGLSALASTHRLDAVARSYLLNTSQLLTGGGTGTNAQIGLGRGLTQSMGNTGLNYADVSSAFGTLTTTGVMGGAYGASRMGSVGFLSAINPMQGNQVSATQVASTFTSQNYYKMRLAGINASIASGQNIQQIFDQIINRVEGAMGRPATNTEIMSGLQQGTHLNADLMAMGLSPDMVVQIVQYWSSRRRTGRTGLAAIQGSGAQNNAAFQTQQAGAAQARAGAKIDRGFIPGVSAGARLKGQEWNAVGAAADNPAGAALTYAAGAVSDFTSQINKATTALKYLVEWEVTKTVTGIGSKAARLTTVTGDAAEAGTFASAAAKLRGLSRVGKVGVVGAAVTGAQAVNYAAGQSEAYAKTHSLRNTFTTGSGLWHMVSDPPKNLVVGAGKAVWGGINDAKNLVNSGLSSALHFFGGSSSPGGVARTGAGATGTQRGGVNASSVISMAERFLGTPYRWGGASPQTGFDCSGLVQYAYSRAGINLPRTAADQERTGTPVAPDDVQPGDLLFLGDPAHHVMMSIGGGKVIEAPHTGDVVKIIGFPANAATAIRRVIGSSNRGGLGAAPSSGRTGDPGDTSGVTDKLGTPVNAGALIGDIFSASSGSVLLAALAGSFNNGAAGGATGQPVTGSGSGSGPVTVPPAPTSVSGNVALGRRMAAQRGWAGAEWDALYWLWNHESGWRSDAKNPASGAYGIPQSLPANKMASAGADYQRNPATQIKWGLDYLSSRYHDPLGAVAHERRYNWYERGAFDVLRDEIAQLHKGEMVLPAGTAAKVRQLVDTPQSTQQQHGGTPYRRTVPVQLIFHVSDGNETTARRHAKRFAELVAEEHGIDMVAMR